MQCEEHLESQLPLPEPGRSPSILRYLGRAVLKSWLTWTSIVGTFVGALAVFLGFGALGAYNLNFIYAHLPSAAEPAEVSLELTTLSFAIGFGLALPLALIRAFPPGRKSVASRRSAVAPRSRVGSPRINTSAGIRKVGRALLCPFYAFATVYVASIRGTPFLVQCFLVYYAVIFSYPRLEILGATAPFWAGLLALTLNTTGYQAEALRGGLQSVDAAQVEAAKALGLSRFQTFRRVIFPQSLRLVVLPLTNEWISNFKTSTILSFITVIELYYWARTDIALQFSRGIEAFVMLVIVYLVINVTLSRTITYIEKTRRIPGLGSMIPELAARAELLATAPSKR